MTYQIAQHIDPNKIFLVNRSELEGRIEVEYYLPEINQLEKGIRNKSTKKLKNFIVKIASGATPSVQEEEKFYSDEINGIPFLRVQNLNTNSHLDLSNVKYINEETHKNYLRRSQVLEGDLLVKITGVGRMAVASVAPNGFVGNTNQHLVVIKTEKIEISKYLANYLNLDIIERLASRRSTGATRPALDYPALKSIPIIEGIDFSILDEAEKLKRQKEAEAKALLESIDTYLLGELGITLPEQDNSLNNRIFTTKFSEVVGERFDSNYYSEINRKITQAISKSNYQLDEMKNYCEFVPGYAFSSDYYVESSDCILVTIKNISQNTVDLNNSTFLPSDFYYKYENFRINKDDLLIAMTGATIGKVGIFDKDKKALINQRNGIIKSRKLNTFYLMSLLNTDIYQLIILRNSVGGAQPNISEKNITKIEVPIPPLEKQTEIAAHIQNIRSQAKALQLEATRVLEEAKREVEKMILGE